jgi:hypothetical protein
VNACTFAGRFENSRGFTERQRRKSLSGAGLAAAATVLFMLGAFLGWRYYADWRLGLVVLTTEGPPLAVDVLPTSSGGRPIGEPLDIGTRSVLTLSRRRLPIARQGNGTHE